MDDDNWDPNERSDEQDRRDRRERDWERGHLVWWPALVVILILLLIVAGYLIEFSK